MSSPRFRFGTFLVSPAHRSLRQDDIDIAVIPRYFDLLVLLLSLRHRVVTRQEIFERVWGDVVVSDGALSQAIRTIRRCLGDDPRDPQFIRTVSRQGYQFVGIAVAEESDDGPLPARAGHVAPLSPAETAPADADAMAPLLDQLLRHGAFTAASDEERREAAERLHALGTSGVLDRLDRFDRLDRASDQAEARAILRDTRWDVPRAGDVSLLGSPQPWAAIVELVSLRLRRAARQTSNRWGFAALGGVVAGLVAGALGGVALWLVPESAAQPSIVLALAMVGGAAGALGAAGIGAGLAAAEALARSSRIVGLVCCGALGGGLVGAIAHVLARALIAGLFGHDVPAAGGWVEGVVLGGAAGLGYGLSTPLPGGGLAAPRGRARVRAALFTAVSCAIAAVVVTMFGGHFVGASLDVMATAFSGSNVGLAPIARLLGEEGLRPLTRTAISAFEGLMFGTGLTFGLTHRPQA